jgi:hypothetical protein
MTSVYFARLRHGRPWPRAIASPCVAFLLAVVVTPLGCTTKVVEESAGGRPEAGAPAPAVRGGVSWLVAPERADVAALVRIERARAAAQHRQLLVYVGAVWCEPCQRFHHAARAGELDPIFPSLTVLEFDLDRDHELLASAGYASHYIPLFALPKEDGTASGRQVEGGIKGDGAVGFITAKVKDLLEPR